MSKITIAGKALAQIRQCANKAKEITGRNCLLDILYCCFRYRASAKDYIMFEFYKINSHERNLYETFYRHDVLMKRLQKSMGGGKIADNKELEYGIYKELIHRDWILVLPTDDDEKIISFLKNKEFVIAKPTNESLGRGVVKISCHDKKAIEKLLEDRRGRKYLIEDCIQNHPDFGVLNQSSLNTIRAFTLIDKEGRLKIFEVLLRVGLPGMHVDNWGAGGVLYHVDIETGMVDRAGIDKTKKRYIYHPGSNVKMLGFQVPNYDGLLEYVKRLTAVLPKAQVVGWDIAITPDGFDLVEMNCPGGHDIMQVFGTPYYKWIMNNI